MEGKRNKDGWFHLSEGNSIDHAFFAGETGKMLSGLVKTYPTIHFYERTELRNMLFFPQRLRGRLSVPVNDPTETLLRQEVLNVDYPKLSNFAETDPRRNKCSLFIYEVRQQLYWKNALAEAQKIYDSRKEHYERLGRRKDAKELSLEGILETVKRRQEDKWALECLFELFPFDKMVIVKFTTCKAKVDVSRGAFVRCPMRDENGRVIPSDDLDDMVHKITFAYYFIDKNGEKQWYTMGVDVIATKSGPAPPEERRKVKHIKNDPRLFLARSDSLAGPSYHLKFGGGTRKIPVYLEVDHDAFGAAFADERHRLHSECQRLYSPEGYHSPTVQAMIEEDLLIWEKDAISKYHKNVVHSWGYQATTIINEMFHMDKNVPSINWEKKGLNKYGYPPSVANWLKYSNPENLPLT